MVFEIGWGSAEFEEVGNAGGGVKGNPVEELGIVPKGGVRPN
jgi:hypothetical protein